MFRIFIMFMLALHVAENQTIAVITTYTNKQQWQTAVGDFTQITFQELPPATWVSDQYAHLGITFDLTSSNFSQIQTSSAFANDGVGLNSFGPYDVPWPRLLFTNLTYAVACDNPASFANFWLYHQGIQIGNATVVSGSPFKGIISTVPCDEVRYMPKLIDDLYFGPPIPAPGVLALLGLAACIVRLGRRRR